MAPLRKVDASAAVRMLRTMLNTSTSRKVPQIFPRPPIIAVPPMDTAAMASSSNPVAALEAATAVVREAYSSAAMPDIAPVITNTVVFTASTLIPESRADTSLLPTS